MENNSAHTIKWENTNAVFSAIADAGKTSRAKIAAHTGLSLMTVGKVIDKLAQLGVLTQAKNDEITAGRKARLAACDKRWHMLLLDMTALNFRLCVLDLSLQIIDDAVYRYDEGMFCEENLLFFLKNMGLYRKTVTDPQFCLGMTVLMPGAYDAQADRIRGTRLSELGPMRPMNLLKAIFPALHIELIEDIRAASLAALRRIPRPHTGTRLWLSLNRPVSGVLILDGIPVLGKHSCAGRFGEITVGTNFTLDQALVSLTDKTEQAAAVAIALYSLIAATDPEEILLESSLLSLDDSFMQSIVHRLEQMNTERSIPLPAIARADNLLGQAARGAALLMRDAWLEALSDE
ncbi:MAG: ROK family protein [Clostridia bacterium]|nr:ROK family protein [Clostridia bacterium]